MFGKCQGMCPKREIIWREKERLLHKFEILNGTENDRSPKADPAKMVKEYSRPAAGQGTFLPEDLRPSPVLRKTVEYLLQSVVPLEVKWSVIYQFVSDRLRAVCQDMTVQNLKDSNCIWILEASVRFYIYSSYVLCEEIVVVVYDSHINNTLLMECLKRLLVMYSESEHESENQEEMIAYYLIYNLGSSAAIHYSLQQSKELRTRPVIAMALKLNFAYLRGNFYRVLKYYNKMPPLFRCCLHRHVELIRFHYLQQLSVGFNCKNNNVSLQVLSKWLRMNSPRDALEICEYYGLKVENGVAYFTKSSFNNSKALSTTRENPILTHRLNKLNLTDLISCIK